MLYKYTVILPIVAKYNSQDTPVLWCCLFDQLIVVFSFRAIQTEACESFQTYRKVL
jgi:hypothetical protein